MFLLFKTYSLAEVMYLPIRFKKAKSCETKNTDINGINEQKTHTIPHIEKDNVKKG